MCVWLEKGGAPRDYAQSKLESYCGMVRRMKRLRWCVVLCSSLLLQRSATIDKKKLWL